MWGYVPRLSDPPPPIKSFADDGLVYDMHIFRFGGLQICFGLWHYTPRRKVCSISPNFISKMPRKVISPNFHHQENHLIEKSFYRKSNFPESWPAAILISCHSTTGSSKLHNTPSCSRTTEGGFAPACQKRCWTICFDPVINTFSVMHRLQHMK